MGGYRVDSLPEFYDENMVGFFSQGPGIVFVYWELSGSQWRVVAGLGGEIAIRLYRVIESRGFDSEYRLVKEVQPPPYTNNWYFDHLEPDSVYSFEVGCRLPDGSFFSMVRSETTSTPPEPRFDSMPKMNNGGYDYTINIPETRAAGDGGATPAKWPALAEVIESMPFYMGYDTQLAG